MKLIYCPECRDMVLLIFEERSCQCGKSFGYYKPDGHNAVTGGTAIVIGFDNQSFENALSSRLDYDDTRPFIAYVMPRVYHSVKHYPKKVAQSHKSVRKTENSE